MAVVKLSWLYAIAGNVVAYHDSKRSSEVAVINT
jgi:hypothetical protein